MGTYNGIPFTVQREGGLFPMWESTEVVARTHLPYTNRSDVQFGGAENPTITLVLQFSALANYEAFAALRFTSHTLSALGSVYEGVYLVGIDNPRQDATGSYYVAQAVFEREAGV